MAWQSAPTLDDDVIARLLHLRSQVQRPGEDVLATLVGLFEADGARRIAAMKSGHDEERRRAAHALKGSALNVGAQRVALLAAVIEQGDGAELTGALETELALAVAALRGRLC
jgi:HPt (histidine-containing phosphotransfer) domain-containing protein